MKVFTCLPDLESMLTCIYDAWASGLGHQNLRLETEPIEQLSMFDEYVHVESDTAKVESVMDAVNMKISPSFYSDIVYISIAMEKDALDIMYRMLILGFAYGPKAIDMRQYAEVTRYHDIRRRLERESMHFLDCLRFTEIRPDVYVAHIEPKSRVAVTLAPSFEDRMPSLTFVIVDDVHKEAVIHPANEHFFMRKLDDYELKLLLESELIRDEYTDLWKLFFDTIAIKERTNYKCQRNLFPLWTRKHAVEFY